MVIFDNVNVTGKVGIGISNPAEKLEVDGKVKATTFEGEGSEITDLDGEKITTGIIDDARISQTITRESRFDPTSGHKHTGGTGDGPKISHSNLSDILQVDPGLIDNDFTKHVSNALAKGWQDHLTNSNNPHGTTAAQLIDYLKLNIVQFIFTQEDADRTTKTSTVLFVPKLVLISGGYTVTLGGSMYGSAVSGFWINGQETCSSFEVIKDSADTAITAGIDTSSSFYLKGTAFVSPAKQKSETVRGTITFSSGNMTVTLIRRKQPDDDPLEQFVISLTMLCIG